MSSIKTEYYPELYIVNNFPVGFDDEEHLSIIGKNSYKGENDASSFDRFSL